MNDLHKTKEELLADLSKMQEQYNTFQSHIEKEPEVQKQEDSILKKLIEASEDFIHFTGDIPDYNKILQTIYDISGAKFAVLNIFEENGRDFKTVAITGIPDILKKTSSILGFDLIHKSWKYDPIREEKTKKENITRFDNLHDLVSDALSKSTVYLIEKSFSIQEVFVVKVVKDCKVLGDFTLLFEKGKSLLNPSLVDLYAHQVGMFLDRNKITSQLRESEEKYRHLIENSHDIIYTINSDGILNYVSPAWTTLLGHPIADVTNKSFQDFVHPDDIPHCLEWIEKVINSSQPQDGVEYRVKHLDGHYCWHTSCAVPLMDNSGKAIGYEGIASDITERKLSAEALLETEWKFRALFEKGPIGVAYHKMIYDANGKPVDYYFLDANESYQELTGVNPRFQTVTKAFPGIENDPFDWIGTFGKVAKTGESIRFEAYLEPNQRWYDCVGYQYKPDHFVAAFLEITKRKIAEKELSNLNERISTATRSAQVGIWDWDLVSNNLIWDDQMYLLYGLKRVNASEKFKLWQDVVHPDDLKRCEAEILRAIKDEAVFDTEFRVIWPDESIHTIKSKADIYRDENGKSIRMIGVNYDITEQKQAEDKIREKDIQFRKLSANVSDLIYQFTRKPDGTYFVPIASEGIKNIFGCEPDDVLNDFSPIAKVLHPEDSDRVISDIEYSAQHLTNFTCEFRVQIPGREVQWIYSKSTPEKLADGSVTWYGFNANITERKTAEEELVKAKEKAQESDRLKSAFLANMSHEIRTPMNGIIGFAGLLKEPGLTGEDQQEYIRIIEKSGARMLNIINDIIDISKIEAGLMKVDLKESNINEQVEYIYTFFKPEVETKGIQLSFKNSLNSKDSTLIIDREKLYAILINLVKNAIKFTNEGSIEFGYEMKGNYLEFFVKDTGSGIPKDRQQAIFERFIQADIADKMARQGAGLGLSITKAYVEMLGGRIWVDSEIGVGSTFYFTIPFQNKPDLDRFNIKDSLICTDKPVDNLIILIAEDDDASRKYLEIALKPFSKQVFKAKTGLEAVELCRNHPDIDLVLMDIQMPEMNGYEASRQIRDFNKDVILIAQTAFGLSGDKEKALESGCNDYISKPINKDKLRTLIHNFFR